MAQVTIERNYNPLLLSILNAIQAGGGNDCCPDLVSNTAPIAHIDTLLNVIYAKFLSGVAGIAILKDISGSTGVIDATFTGGAPVWRMDFIVYSGSLFLDAGTGAVEYLAGTTLSIGGTPFQHINPISYNATSGNVRVTVLPFY